MIDLPRDTEPTGLATRHQGLVVNVRDPSAHPEDSLHLLERWANPERPNSLAVSALATTTAAAAVRLPFLFD